VRSWRSSSRLFDGLVTTCDGPHEEATAMQTNLFPLGRVVITANAHTRLSEQVVLVSLARHANGDWGDVCEDDRRENEFSLERGFRLLSVYRDESETTFWIITEADRSATIVLMPDEY
jgi:hypothetical protein